MEVKCLKVPFIEGLEQMECGDFDLAMELGAAKAAVDVNGWPEAFPYTPACHFSVAQCGSHLAVQFHVRGLDLRARALKDGEATWEDSCCECFLMDADGVNYFNFELNCIGTLLGGRGSGRHDRVPVDGTVLEGIRRFSTLPRRAVDEKDGRRRFAPIGDASAQSAGKRVVSRRL